MSGDALSSFGDWKLVRQLGQGGFGEVHLWRHSITEREIATKRLKENQNLSIDEIKKVELRWRQEHKWMQELVPPFIVRGERVDDPAFLDYLHSRHAWPKLPVILMEYCNGGDLRAQLQRTENVNGLHEYEVRQVLHALRHAVEYLHTQCRIEHRDLKPDNVVINVQAGQRIYKLTDFGFARNSTENTMLKSIVGTRNYVAPEMLDTAIYNNTVDYWSLGVIAFEIICGKLPFIPHQNLLNIVTTTRKKSADCIAITEHADQANSFIFHSELFPENRISRVFAEKVEKWLRLALDVNYRTRGCRPVAGADTKLTFFEDLDGLLASKVLTVFCLNTYKFYSYEVTEEMTLAEWSKAVERDTHIESNKFFLIFPTGHPRSALSADTKPIDFFVEEFQDTSDSHNPPVMLYLLGYQCDYNASNPNISDLLKKCVSSNGQVPDWLLRSFEQHTHFLLSNEQRHLDAYLTGLKEYSLTMEHEIITFEQQHLKAYSKQIQYMLGQIDGFHVNVEQARTAHETELPNGDAFFRRWVKEALTYKSKINDVERLGQWALKRHISILRRATEQATNTVFDKFIEDDIYALADFRHHLVSDTHSKALKDNRLEVCKKAAHECIDKRQEFLHNVPVVRARKCLAQVHLEFEELKSQIWNTRVYLDDVKEKLKNDTSEMHKQLANAYSTNVSQSGGNRQQVLKCDGTSPFTSLNDYYSSLPHSNELLHVPADAIYAEISNTLQQCRLAMDMDTNEIPTVIDQAKDEK